MGVGNLGCNLILLRMELEHELTDSLLELSLELLDVLRGLLKLGHRGTQFVLRRLAVSISEGSRDRRVSAEHGDDDKSEGRSMDNNVLPADG